MASSMDFSMLHMIWVIRCMQSALQKHVLQKGK